MLQPELQSNSTRIQKVMWTGSGLYAKASRASTAPEQPTSRLGMHPSPFKLPSLHRTTLSVSFTACFAPVLLAYPT